MCQQGGPGLLSSLPFCDILGPSPGEIFIYTWGKPHSSAAQGGKVRLPTEQRPSSRATCFSCALDDTIENASEVPALWSISLAHWNFRLFLPLPGSYRKPVSPHVSPRQAPETGQLSWSPSQVSHPCAGHLQGASSPGVSASARPLINHRRQLCQSRKDIQGRQEALVFTGVPQTHAHSRKSKHSRHTKGSMG